MVCHGLRSEPKQQLVGGPNTLGELRPVYSPEWILKKTDFVCEHLDCGVGVSEEQR